MSQLDTANTIIAALRAGMTTGYDDTDDFFVRKWYTGDPLQLPSFEVPAGAVILQPAGASETEFVGVDNVIEPFTVEFWTLARRKEGEDAETAAGITKLIAIYDKARQLVRTDPTFGGLFVTSSITGVEPLMGAASNGAYRTCKFILTIKRPVLWGQ